MSFKWDYELLYHACFDDRSVDGWIDGLELIKNPTWTEEQRKRWFYFYRPHQINIGEPQLKEIYEINLKIKEIKSTLSEKLALFSLFFIASSLAFIRGKLELLLFFILFLLYFFIKISQLQKTVLELNKNKITLKNKISELIDQCNEINNSLVNDSYIEKAFWSDINELEDFFLKSSFKNSGKVKSEMIDFYKDIRLKSGDHINYPTFPVIPTWALLQPSQRISVDGEEFVGINKAVKDIGRRVASWRNVDQGKTFFRLWHLHFLFFQEKNIDIISVYYDFISKRPYNAYMETYPYNHITNYSYVDLDISSVRNSELIKNINLPHNLTENIFSNEVKTLAFSSSSGSYYKCVLPDRDIAKGLEKWLKYKQNELDTEIKSDGYKVKITRSEKEMIFNPRVNLGSFSETIASKSLEMLRKKVEAFSVREKTTPKKIDINS